MSSITRLAFVDDEIGMQQIFRIFFKKAVREGLYEIWYFTSGEECLEFLRKDRDSQMIVLTDINMPGMDGFSLLGLIKSEFPKMQVVMVSAYSSQDIIEKAFLKGANGYLTKPIDVQVVKDKISELKKANEKETEKGKELRTFFC